MWVPIDHGLSDFPETGLSPITSLLDSLRDGADAVVAQKGLVGWAVHGSGYDDIRFIAHLSASTVHAGEDSQRKVLVGTPAEARDRGAVGVSVQVNLGSVGEAAMLEALGQVTSEAYGIGLPTLGMIYPRGPNLRLRPDDATGGVAHAVRLAFEIGCDFVKVPLIEHAVDAIVSAAPIPVLFAGGSADGDFQSILRGLEAAMRSGAAGACIGRHIFGAADVVGRLKAVRAVVHEGVSAETALTRYG